MFSNKRKPGVAARLNAGGGAGLSLIGAELAVSGDLVSGGQLHVDGRVDGNVRCAGLCQSDSGVISGDIFAEEARIGGLVQGDVRAGIVVIEASGRVCGDVAYDTISIAAGAQVDGRLARRAALVTAEQQPAPAVSRQGEEGAGSEAAAADEVISLFSGRPTRIVVD